ncbi:hypothetical protein BKA66DRAFT_477779 [Pyrenochaeta sp. MPI-SDFR-AT-0127]|nr:hypothetical protein BKA66DRAFT_477779 [Pyrenochaeta sp. MPI-SDFR-AT-0127]
MSSINATVFHAYTYGTTFWYGLRGLCRVYDPVMVAGWFRPPSQLNLAPNDLELYNIRNDGWCLITLALILISLTNAVPFASPSSAFPSTTPSTSPKAASGSTPYAKAVIAATIFHHITTGFGAYQHYKLETHNNPSMVIGVWGNVWLTLTGLLTLVLLQSDAGDQTIAEVAKKVS